MPIGEICGCLRPSIYHSGACRRLSLAHRDRLGVELFDFVLGGRGSSCGRGDFDFYQGFGKGFGVDVACFVQSLGVGVDGVEVAASGEAGEEGAQAALVFFDASIILIRIISEKILVSRTVIRYPSNFRDFTGKDKGGGRPSPACAPTTPSAI